MGSERRRTENVVLSLKTHDDGSARTLGDLKPSDRKQLARNIAAFRDTFGSQVDRLGIESLCELLASHSSAKFGDVAWFARQVLDAISVTKDEIAIQHADSAARFAFLAGFNLARAVEAQTRDHNSIRSKPGGNARGLQLAGEAKELEAKMLRLSKKYQSSDELQDLYRSKRAYLAKELKVSTRTVNRRLKRQ